MSGPRYPAVVVHGAVDIEAVLAFGAPVTLLSGSAAALYAGAGWWLAMMAHVRKKNLCFPIDNVLDCADAAGMALAALRLGQRRLVLLASAPGWQAVAAVAGVLDGEILTTRPAALDMAERDARRRLATWLQGQSGRKEGTPCT